MHFNPNKQLSDPLIGNIFDFAGEQALVSCTAVSKAFQDKVNQIWNKKVGKLSEQPAILRAFGNIKPIAYQAAPLPFLLKVFTFSCRAKERRAEKPIDIWKPINTFTLSIEANERDGVTQPSINEQARACVQASSLVMQIHEQVREEWALNLCAFFNGVAKQCGEAQVYLTLIDHLSLSEKAEELYLWLHDPHNREKIEMIEELDIKSLKLTTLPSEIALFKGLKKLDIGYNKLISLPDIFDSLENLEELFLSGNRLRSLPASVGRLVKLQELCLHNNQFRSLPEFIGSLVNLTKFSASQNQLTSLPESIGLLVKLKRLSIYGNNLTVLPRSIGLLVNLVHLFLSHNKLSSLPETIGGLVKLEELHLNTNELTTVPETIGSLVNLQGLWLDFNKVISLPKSTASLVSLKQFWIGWNPIRESAEVEVVKDCKVIWF